MCFDLNMKTDYKILISYKYKIFVSVLKLLES